LPAAFAVLLKSSLHQVIIRPLMDPIILVGGDVGLPEELAVFSTFLVSFSGCLAPYLLGNKYLMHGELAGSVHNPSGSESTLHCVVGRLVGSYHTHRLRCRAARIISASDVESAFTILGHEHQGDQAFRIQTQLQNT
jgi:hypothetical protein